MDIFNPALITVIMPCFNAASIVEGSIQSVLGQSYPQVELIVVDDGSTDGSTDIIQQQVTENPGRITVHYQNRGGPFAARNHGLAHSSGNFIAFLDAGDLWAPDMLGKLHEALSAAQADLAYCGWQNVGIAATDLTPKIPDTFEATDAIGDFMNHDPWPINSVLVRRQLIDDVFGFSERAPTAMDFDLWLRILARQPRLVRVPDVLAYCHHDQRTKARIPRWQQVCDAMTVRRDFANKHPKLLARFTPIHLRELIYSPLLREAYRCHWSNDTESARRLFRRAFRKSDWKAGDFKHLLASLLPAPLYRRLVDRVTRRRSARIEN